MVFFFTDNNNTPTKVVLSCFRLLVGLWQYREVKGPKCVLHSQGPAPEQRTWAQSIIKYYFLGRSPQSLVVAFAASDCFLYTLICHTGVK